MAAPAIDTTVAPRPTAPAKPRTNYLNADYGVSSWLLTVDHKDRKSVV